MNLFDNIPNDPDSCSLDVVLSKYGVTMYTAQIIEGDLQIILTSLEMLGLVQIDRNQYKVTNDKYGAIEACIGPMIYWLQEHSIINLPPNFIKNLKKANMQRNLLAHRFLYSHAVELVTNSGREEVCIKLDRIFSHLFQVMNELIRVRNIIFSQFGLTDEVMQKRLAVLLDDLRNDEKQRWQPDN